MKNYLALRDSLIEEVWAGGKQPASGLVYHYTDASGLAGILSSKSLWATEYRFVNDASEVELGMRRTKMLIRNLTKKTKDSKLVDFLESLEAQIVAEEESEETQTSYVVSFSTRHDDLS